jgi:DNA-directed RNA polymerase subunit beta'
LDNNGEIIKTYFLLPKSNLLVEDGEEVEVGTTLAKVPRNLGHTRDITGGLPRVTELFEARVPQNSAVISEIDGIIGFGGQKRDKTIVTVTSHDGLTKREYLVPNKQILVQEKDEVKSCDRITDGPINPHDLLKNQGPRVVQDYLVNQIQEVYKLQGVVINDKHIEVIVRQMSQKVRVVHSGDSPFIENDTIDARKAKLINDELKNKVIITDKGDSKFTVADLYLRKQVIQANKELKNKNKKPVLYKDTTLAKFDQILLGITQAASSTES